MARNQIKPQKSICKKKYKKICVYCNSKDTKKRGFRYTNRGKVQRYFCKSCKRNFIIDDGFFRMRNPVHKITLCIDLFFKGVSTRKIQDHLQAFYPHNTSHVSIYKWIIRYSNLISKFTDKLNLNVGSEIQIDEMEYKTQGKQSYFIDVMDTKTRYLITSNYVKSRSKNKIKELFNTTKGKTQKQIKVVTTDGFMLYRKLVKKSFGYNKNLMRYNVEHNIINASEGEGFNHKIERLHNSIRQLTQNFRGFHGSLYSAKSIMKGYEIYYNFIRKHQAIGKCPYEVAIPQLKFNSNNKWLELIHKAKFLNTNDLKRGVKNEN